MYLATPFSAAAICFLAALIAFLRALLSCAVFSGMAWAAARSVCPCARSCFFFSSLFSYLSRRDWRASSLLSSAATCSAWAAPTWQSAAADSSHD
ncbi:MAG: hypothetical protein HY812_11935 [Planctomycetes bacterium]|nr:hypothetical protein [Planctomycetota bacterium]